VLLPAFTRSPICQPLGDNHRQIEAIRSLSLQRLSAMAPSIDGIDTLTNVCR
jgi:hypothetical protein